MREEAVAVLRESLSDTDPWTKVHAAEALIRLDYRQGVQEVFDKELAEHGDDAPYRIGIWRVQAQLAYDQNERDRWVGKIREAFLDIDGPDRENAAETLGKLGYSANKEDNKAFSAASEDTTTIFTSMVRWVLANDGTDATESRLVVLLDSKDEQTRLGSAYALNREPADSNARPFLLSAAFVLAPSDQIAPFKRMLVKYAEAGDKGAKYELCEALADRGDTSDVVVLSALLEDSVADVRVAAANTIL
jgi:solute:Na+ symporter, SSS family